MNRKAAPFVENISEATAACLITMVQGNVLLLGLSHWLIATQTGVAAGTLTALILLFARTRKRWIVSLLLGAITACVDYLVHPGTFGPVFAEALVTGAGAAALSYLVGGAVQAARARRAA